MEHDVWLTYRRYPWLEEEFSGMKDRLYHARISVADLNTLEMTATTKSPYFPGTWTKIWAVDANGGIVGQVHRPWYGLWRPKRPHTVGDALRALANRGVLEEVMYLVTVLQGPQQVLTVHLPPQGKGFEDLVHDALNIGIIRVCGELKRLRDLDAEV